MKYVNEIKKFESSLLFKNYYQRFVAFLKMSGHHFKSKELETVLNISGAQVRKLTQHARRNGVVVILDIHTHHQRKRLRVLWNILKDVLEVFR